MTKDILMSHDTEKLVKILQGSESPTDMALIILANKIDDLKDDLSKLTTQTDQKIKDLRKETQSARWLHTHRKPLIFVTTILLILSSFGIKALVEFIKTKIGM
ncbi:MAG: hypothetical protein EOM67_13095 [Spirochaetia bacterium]|nr:hypothetical protein [Spirochaetia bacterium]